MMQDILVVVDMQNDFISGPLGTPEARAILPGVVEKARFFSGLVLYTRDTHEADYLRTQEGGLLPVPHCVRGSEGWEIHPDLEPLRKYPALDKPAFGSLELARILQETNAVDPVRSVTFVGLCTDFCVISNAMIAKAALPEARIVVDAACCAGATQQGHLTALSAMKTCQIFVQNETQ